MMRNIKQLSFPKILTDLYNPSKIEMNYLDLCKLELKISS